jgi:Fe-S oxidoreductase
MSMGIIDFIKDKLNFGNTLYYPGCLTRYAAPDIEKNYVEILNKIGLDFIHIPEFYCCGIPTENAGYKGITSELLEKNANLFRKHGVTRIITNCPSCYYKFKQLKGFKVQHITEVLAERLNYLDEIQEGDITYQEPCHLGRKSGVYEEPRAVLKKLGFNIIEQDHNRENSVCCGAGGGLKTNHPELANKIAQRYFKTAKTKRIITACGLCYLQLKENAPKDVEVYELSQVVLNKIEDIKKSGKDIKVEKGAKLYDC